MPARAATPSNIVGLQQGEAEEVAASLQVPVCRQLVSKAAVHLCASARESRHELFGRVHMHRFKQPVQDQKALQRSLALKL